MARAAARIQARLAKHLTLCALAACALAATAQISGERVVVQGLVGDGAGGIYDPSLAEDGSERLWMSYSAVQPSPIHGLAFNAISTRVAYSDDRGRDWTDAGVVNRSTDVRLPPPHDRLAAKWEHEVSRLAFDPWAPEPLRWKLLWHRYLRVHDGQAPDSAPLFEHGWIELKTAPDPRGPWSAGRKLFAGSHYNRANDTTIGPPELRLDRLFSGAAALGDCLAFTEPGAFARADAVYVSLKCATGRPTGKVVLLACRRDFRACDFKGIFLRDADAARFGRGYSGFSATELVAHGERVFLAVTPTREPGESYHGCLFFEVAALDRARLRGLEPQLVVSAGEGVINGACGYTPGAADGVYLSRYFPGTAQPFRIVRTGVHPRY